MGFFGKLPGYGDFVQRNVCPDFAKNWDNWLLKSLDDSHQQLGENWRQSYFSSPIWRFVLNKGALSKTTVAGLMMPSVDKAGRCYPFTVICQAETPVNPFILARKIDPIHVAGEDFLLSLLEKKRPDLDEITKVLGDIYSVVDESSNKSAGKVALASIMELTSVSELNQLDFSTGNESFLQTLMDNQNINISIWSMGSTIAENPQIRYFSGMPPTDTFYSFLHCVQQPIS
ncbi:MAG: type VI secretion system protein ImpM [Paraglaciecola sp.]